MSRFRNQILSVYRPIITRIENLVKDQIAEVLKQHNQLPKVCHDPKGNPQESLQDSSKAILNLNSFILRVFSS